MMRSITAWLWKRNPRTASVAFVAMAVLMLSVADVRLVAQSFTVLHTFNGGDGNYPTAGLIRDSAGNLYGTTVAGGNLGLGTVFKLSKAGLRVLYRFPGSPSDGAYPYGPLVRDAAGNFYGTTSRGGATDGGTVFKLDASGKETVLYNFVANSSDGMLPSAGLIRDAAGNLFGTASSGGTYNGGIVFEVDSAGTETVLHNFAGAITDGTWPQSGLLLANGRLYGTTPFGGTSNLGTIFVLNKSLEKVVYNFADAAGEFPAAGLIKDSRGNFYGTTQFGGNLSCNAPSSGCGTVFKLDADGNQTVLYSFLGSPDGDDPVAGVVLDDSGTLYGTTVYGGTGTCQDSPPGCGTIFKVDQNGKETVLFNFTGGADGKFPFGGLVRDSKGNLYGTTSQGGSAGCFGSGCGTVFKLTP